MQAQLYHVKAGLSGTLSIAARPRGGDWLEDEIAAWRHAGVNRVVSLLTHDEERDLDLASEKQACIAQGLQFTSLPIEDRDVPSSATDASRTIDSIYEDLVHGKNVVVHCRQGIGRSALLVAGVLVESGWPPAVALARISADRGIPVPETPAQHKWVDQFAIQWNGRNRSLRPRSIPTGAGTDSISSPSAARRDPARTP